MIPIPEITLSPDLLVEIRVNTMQKHNKIPCYFWNDFTAQIQTVICNSGYVLLNNCEEAHKVIEVAYNLPECTLGALFASKRCVYRIATNLHVLLDETGLGCGVAVLDGMNCLYISGPEGSEAGVASNDDKDVLTRDMTSGELIGFSARGLSIVYVFAKLLETIVFQSRRPKKSRILIDIQLSGTNAKEVHATMQCYAESCINTIPSAVKVRKIDTSGEEGGASCEWKQEKRTAILSSLLKHVQELLKTDSDMIFTIKHKTRLWASLANVNLHQEPSACDSICEVEIVTKELVTLAESSHVNTKTLLNMMLDMLQQ